MSPLVILLPRKGYLQHFCSKIANIVRCYCHDLGQSERNIFDFSLCVTVAAVWTEKQFIPLLTRPQGSQGCQKIRIFFTNKTVKLENTDLLLIFQPITKQLCYLNPILIAELCSDWLKDVQKVEISYPGLYVDAMKRMQMS